MPAHSEPSRFERVRWYRTEAVEPSLSLLAVDATVADRHVVDMLVAANLPAELIPITMLAASV